MLQKSVIREIILWIEQHLESRLSLDIVADRSGYTKWHFQRIFKSQTGLALGAYIRARRLSCAAASLRLTSDSVMDISLKYRFDSQQTFCRAFKKQFNITPSDYRRKQGWSMKGFCLPLRTNHDLRADVKLVTLPARRLVGVKHKYTREIPEWNLDTQELRRHYWLKYFELTRTVTENLYAFHGVDNTNESVFSYATTFDEQFAAQITAPLEHFEIPQGDYLELKLVGDLSAIDYKDIIYAAYGKALVELDILRKEGCDIEHYVLKDGVTYDEFLIEPHKYVKGLNYYIPVII